MQFKPTRKEFCTICRASTCWELEPREQGPVYVCKGDDQKHPERKVHGCGHELAADLFFARYSYKRV